MNSIHTLALATLMACCGVAAAAERSRISVHTVAGGKEVARIMLPIGQQHSVQVEANQVEQDHRGATHARGNVRVTVRSGGATTTIVGEEIIVREGEVLHIPPRMPHQAEALDDTFELDVFSPIRADWLADGES